MKLQLVECCAVARCSVAGCHAVMPGQNITGFEDGALVFCQDVARGWLGGVAVLGSGRTHTVLLCPEHASLAERSQSGMVLS